MRYMLLPLRALDDATLLTLVQIFGYLVAGHETSSTGLSCAFYETRSDQGNLD